MANRSSVRCPADLAEDLLQEALTLGVQRPFVLHMQDAEAERWLRTTARNLFFMHLRRQRRRPEVEDAEVLERVWTQEADSDERAEALQQCLDSLTGRAQQALQLRYQEGMSRKAIGKRLGITTHGIKSMLARVRMTLRTCIERQIR